jgi:hypothetical protein
VEVVVDAQAAAGEKVTRSNASVERRIKQFSKKIQIRAQKSSEASRTEIPGAALFKAHPLSGGGVCRQARHSRGVSDTELTQT